MFTEAEFYKELTKLGIHERPAFVRTAHSTATTHFLSPPKSKSPCVIVAIQGWEEHNGIEIAGLLVHEAVHVWQDYAAYIGETSPGAEQEAYAVQAVAQELMAEFARRQVPTK